MAGTIAIADIRKMFEGYCIDYEQISDDLLLSFRDGKVVPWVESMIGFGVAGVVGRTTEYRSGTGSSIIIMSRRPIVEIFSINLVTNPSNFIFVSPTSVEVIADEGILKLRTVLEAWTSYVPAFPRGKDNIKVDYSYGFATLPVDIADAVCALVVSFALGHLASRTGGGSVNVPGIGRTYGTRGKYGDIRLELERYAVATVRRYMTGTTGS